MRFSIGLGCALVGAAAMVGAAGAQAGPTLYSADNLTDGSLHGVVLLNTPAMTWGGSFLTSGKIDGLATNGVNVYASLPGGVSKLTTAGSFVSAYNNIGVDHFDDLALNHGTLYAADNLTDNSLHGVVFLNTAGMTWSGSFLTNGRIDGLTTDGAHIFASLPNGVAEYNLAGTLLQTYLNIGVDHFDDLSYANGVLYAADNLTDGSLHGVVLIDPAHMTEDTSFLTNGLIDGLATDGKHVWASLPGGVAEYSIGGVLKAMYNNIGVDHFDDLAVAIQASVPEPATWAMLMLGLFALGGALRRRASRAAVA